MNDDGTMARIPDLVPFAQRHGLKIGTIEDLIAYRLRHDSLVKLVTEKEVESRFGGKFRLCVFSHTTEGTEHIALVKGDVTSGGPVLVRVHALNALADVLGIDVPKGLAAAPARAMEIIAREGRGVIVLIRNRTPNAISEAVSPRVTTGKPIGMDRRLLEIGLGSQILRQLGVTDMTLLTNSPSTRYVGLEGYGLKIVGTKGID
jgi:3,4-dihydroxy 2-butanone 4-phosphate synthase/GTP cyclohydrolase II